MAFDLPQTWLGQFGKSGQPRRAPNVGPYQCAL